MTVKITIFGGQFLFGYSYYKKLYWFQKNIVNATKNDFYFNRHCSLYRNKARLSVSQIFVTVTVIFLRAGILKLQFFFKYLRTVKVIER